MVFQATRDAATDNTSVQSHQRLQHGSTVGLQHEACNSTVGSQVQGQFEHETSKAQAQTQGVDQALAEQFTKWFFQMLNSYHPFSQEAPVEGFGPHHFFADCRLKMICETPDLRREVHSGSSEVCRRLLAFVKEEQLKFNPNLDPGGVKGMSNPHGLKAVTVCGTVHLGGRFVGIFEQQFGLVRDPDSQNNLKIKFTNLKLRREHVELMPTLMDTQKILSIDL